MWSFLEGVVPVALDAFLKVSEEKEKEQKTPEKIVLNVFDPGVITTLFGKSKEELLDLNKQFAESPEKMWSLFEKMTADQPGQNIEFFLKLLNEKNINFIQQKIAYQVSTNYSLWVLVNTLKVKLKDQPELLQKLLEPSVKFQESLIKPTLEMSEDCSELEKRACQIFLEGRALVRLAEEKAFVSKQILSGLSVDEIKVYEATAEAKDEKSFATILLKDSVPLREAIKTQQPGLPILVYEAKSNQLQIYSERQQKMENIKVHLKKALDNYKSKRLYFISSKQISVEIAGLPIWLSVSKVTDVIKIIETTEKEKRSWRHTWDKIQFRCLPKKERASFRP